MSAHRALCGEGLCPVVCSLGVGPTAARRPWARGANVPLPLHYAPPTVQPCIARLCRTASEAAQCPAPDHMNDQSNRAGGFSVGRAALSLGRRASGSRRRQLRTNALTVSAARPLGRCTVQPRSRSRCKRRAESGAPSMLSAGAGALGRAHRVDAAAAEGV